MIEFLKRSIKAALQKVGVSRIPFTYKAPPVFIKNVFNSTSSKSVLLSYISAAFVKQNHLNKQHTNIYTSNVLAETLHELGYKVDIVNWLDKFNGNYNDYDLIIGLGNSLDEAFKTKESSTKIIFFATGCNPFYCNQVTIQRVIDFHNRHNKYLMESSRFVYNDWPLQHEAADWIIVHGESFAKATYRDYNISTIKGPVFIKDSKNKISFNWNNKSKHFLWFGSSGVIHKGLDLVLDAFKELNNEDIHLHICGNIFYENGFYEYYQPILNSKYVTYHGHVAIDSDNYDAIMEICGFVIFPSVSEGNSPSVITCMANGGLIPIVTKSADIDISNYGIEIKALSVDAVSDAIKESQSLPLNELIRQSNKIMEYTKQYHSFDYFREDIKNQLVEIMEHLKK